VKDSGCDCLKLKERRRAGLVCVGWTRLSPDSNMRHCKLGLFPEGKDSTLIPIPAKMVIWSQVNERGMQVSCNVNWMRIE